MGKNKNGSTDKCDYPHCRSASELIWLGRGVCNEHFAKICDMPREKAYKKMGVSPQKIKDNEEQCECVGKKKKKGLEHFTKEEK